MNERDEVERPGGHVEVTKVAYFNLDDQMDSDQRDLSRTRHLRDVLEKIQSSIRAYSNSLQIDTCYFAIKDALSKAKKSFQDDWLSFKEDAEQQQVACITSTNLQLNASLEQANALVQELEQWVEQKGQSSLPDGWEVAIESAINALHKHESKVLARTSMTTARMSADGGATKKPTWQRDTASLFFDGKPIKKIRSVTVAKNLVRILDDFEEKGWPDRIDDPLSSSKDQQRLHEAIRRLNGNLSAIRFHADGTGTGIVWEELATDDRTGTAQGPHRD